jgi:hypothetical protein
VVNRAGSTSCIGDTVSYTCTVGGVAHLWRIVPLNSTVVTANIAVGNPTFPADGGAPSPFMIAIASNVNNIITTVLTVTSFAGLEGTNISCRNALVANGEPQETTASVFGECCYDYRGMCNTKMNVV